MSQHKSSSRIIDVLSKQINDPNVKVAINALKVFQELTNTIPSLVESSLSVIMNEVFICFSSAKTEIRTLAEDFFDAICGKI
jgi:phage-related protein